MVQGPVGSLSSMSPSVQQETLFATMLHPAGQMMAHHGNQIHQNLKLLVANYFSADVERLQVSGTPELVCWASQSTPKSQESGSQTGFFIPKKNAPSLTPLADSKSKNQICHWRLGSAARQYTFRISMRFSTPRTCDSKVPRPNTMTTLIPSLKSIQLLKT